jgi:hypothetical protein
MLKTLSAKRTLWVAASAATFGDAKTRAFAAEAVSLCGAPIGRDEFE